MMTIAEFSERTGISPSALRFYERKNLLLPADRLVNGYRAYSRAQVADAKFTHSLRQAGIGIAAIRGYLEAPADEREKLLAAWRRAADARLLEAEIARSYLHGLGTELPPIGLQRWDEPSVLCWLPAEGPRDRLPFRSAIAVSRRDLAQRGVSILEAGYVRATDLASDRVIGEVGFRLEAGRKWRLPSAARLEELEPQLLVGMDCSVNQEKAAHRLFRVLEVFGFSPTALHLERYLPREAAAYQVLVGVRRRSGTGAAEAQSPR